MAKTEQENKSKHAVYIYAQNNSMSQGVELLCLCIVVFVLALRLTWSKKSVMAVCDLGLHNLIWWSKSVTLFSASESSLWQQNYAVVDHLMSQGDRLTGELQEN